MGAETTVYVKRARLVIEWVEVQAITLDGAVKEVESLGGSTCQVIGAQYDKPENQGKEG